MNATTFNTEQRSTVDSRRRLANFKMLVQFINVGSLETVHLLFNVKSSASAFVINAGSHALTPFMDCVTLQALPHANQLLLQVGYIADLHLVNSLLHCASDILIYWIQIWTIRRLQIWRKSVITFRNFRISQRSVVTLQVRWKSLPCIHREFSLGERLVKIGHIQTSSGALF